MKKLLFLLIPIVLIAAYFLMPKAREAANILGTNDTASSTPSNNVGAEELAIHVSPSSVVQGDPVLITVSGLGTSTVRSLTWGGKRLDVFTYNSKPSALAGVDLRAQTGSYTAIATLSDGRSIRKTITVGTRAVAHEELGIPEKLGGNTTESQDNLTSSLIEESRLVASIPSAKVKYWSGLFRLPIDSPITITDVYGITRSTVGTSLSHKGTDFRAAVGTPVYAMNSGKVGYTGYLRNYGNTVIVDHGLGLQTIYMHLSEVLVANGAMVEKGDLIAKSGDTGYVVGPHLHLSVKINGISIDPEKFLKLLGE